MCTCVRELDRVCVYVCASYRERDNVYVCLCACVCVCVCVCASLCVCVCSVYSILLNYGTCMYMDTSWLI